MFPSMYLTVLKAVMARRDQSQADIARAAGVSRQAVSHWFASERDFQNVHVATLLKLSDSLEIDPAELLEPLPGMDDPVAVRRLATEFCWDRAYPDIYRFLAALADGEPRATARLIESRGIYAAAFTSIKALRRELLVALDRHLTTRTKDTLGDVVRRVRTL